ncbi:BREX-3 system P-loop-containing protein BrxF [Burkholderia gladioli]|uniref:BREX-3 system P-loop-containing protein BrxF n=1 Tax=Burkholderia gladioli TaxID=28095 RepID=UPI001FC8AC13|nr:BREX-3 system P-loop-containing protein BrxF [Burkholderia gladioli]
MSILAKLERLIGEIGDLNSKLILLVGPSRSGKTRLLRQLSAKLNVGLELGRRLAATPNNKRGFSAGELLREIADKERTEGQAAVFSALWSFKGVKVDGERVMLRTGQDSNKPNDLFKVKTANKGKPEYEGPLHAYRILVKSNRRPGEYWMPCSAPDFVAA